MTGQADRAKAFRALHVKGRPLVLFNIWDAGSAKAVAAAGARALATGSASVAGALGYADGEGTPLDLVVANLERIVAATDLPVSLDFERGYGTDPATVEAAAARVVAAGALGVNVEDSLPDKRSLRDAGDQAARLRAVRRAAEAAGVPLFINARIDSFPTAEPGARDGALLEQTLERARAYLDAGADGIFIPILEDEALIGRACEALPAPLNILARPDVPPLARLAELGVARVSHGPGPWRQAMRALEDAARAAMS